ncbi:MAG: DUF72 domain-containing protein [Desulfosarcinaceae bacterium]|nr:DUF72 domain-containing protein [Desulfosarcinaceae bacterium]
MSASADTMTPAARGMAADRPGITRRIPNLRVGTSGYAYPEWVTAGFYPTSTPSEKMLPLYARRFGVTELNFTWYQMPKAPAMVRMRERVPEAFGFAVKLTRTLTHEIDPHGWRGQMTRYRDGIAPLVQSAQLLAVLVQLPPSFRRRAPQRRYLAELLDELADLPVAVEFRHSSWATDRVFAELERRRVTLVAVDTPALPGLFPRLDVVTNPDLFYLRFHGRNARGWRSGNMQQQFDYDYTDAELAEWLPAIETMASAAQSGLLFFNNHVRAQAPKNAEQLTAQLGLGGG